VIFLRHFLFLDSTLQLFSLDPKQAGYFCLSTFVGFSKLLFYPCYPSAGKKICWAFLYFRMKLPFYPLILYIVEFFLGCFGLLIPALVLRFYPCTSFDFKQNYGLFGLLIINYCTAIFVVKTGCFQPGPFCLFNFLLPAL
jgi:hypothetical protein